MSQQFFSVFTHVVSINDERSQHYYDTKLINYCIFVLYIRIFARIFEKILLCVFGHWQLV